LIELGHRKIGVLSDSINHIKTRKHKLAGYLQALKQAGIRYDERLIEHAATADFRGGYEAFQALCHRCPDIHRAFLLLRRHGIGRHQCRRRHWQAMS
jgi:DNA-binding LacI/PurR family transcriptional regulator